MNPRLLPVALAFAGAMLVPVAALIAAEKSGKSTFVFSILPKSFQREPRVDLNVITEMTPEGRRRPPPSPEHPIYYVAQAGGFIRLGLSPVANEKPPAIADLERVMAKALLTAGYLPEEPPGHTATIAVVYNWGSHTSPTEDEFAVLNELAAAQAAEEAGTSLPPSSGSLNFAEDQLPGALADLSKRRDLVERAAMVGGGKFALEFGRALADEAIYRSTNRRPPSAFGDADMASSAFDDPASPFGRFYNRDDRTMHLVEEAFSTFYFVIASAYDYAALAKGQRVKLWQTKMTVNSLGVAMKETLPSLVISAGQFLGKDMVNAETITRKILRGGKVEVGTPTVKEYLDTPPPKETPPAKDAKKR